MGIILNQLRASLVVAACVFCAVALSRVFGQAEAEAALLQIEADVFSGRPNPRWELTAPQAAKFLSRLRALQPTQGIRFSQGGLGYRGFIVRVTDGSMNGYDEVKLYRGAVLARQGGRTETFSDPKRILERQLVDSAQGRVPDSVLQYVEDELGR